jgi:hypothetical protein
VPVSHPIAIIVSMQSSGKYAIHLKDVLLRAPDAIIGQRANRQDGLLMISMSARRNIAAEAE